MCASSSTTSSYVPGQAIDRSGNTDYYWRDAKYLGDQSTRNRTLYGDMEKFGESFRLGNDLLGLPTHTNTRGTRVSASAFEGIVAADRFRKATSEEKQAMIDSGEIDPHGHSYSTMMQFVGDFKNLYDPEDPIFMSAPRKYELEMKDGYYQYTDKVSKEYKDWMKQTKSTLMLRRFGGGQIA